MICNYTVNFLRAIQRAKSVPCLNMVNRNMQLNRSQSRSFVDKLFGGNMKAFANALSDGGLTEEELTELKRLLEEQ